MGSRIMHLIIANKIADQLSITDKNSFLLGGIAPDAVSSKETSHFFKGSHENYSRGIDYDAFYEKYRDITEADYILGYYKHLISDDIWLKGFFLSWLRNRQENDEGIFYRYHNDFRLLNGKLLSFYELTKEVWDTVDDIAFIPDLDEVKAKEIKDLLPHVKEDMNYSEQDIDEELSVFTFEQIIGYIETSVEKGIFLLKDKV